MFGFSFGAHVCFEGAYRYGKQTIGRIDACDPTGWGFNSKSMSVLHANRSAQYVQCIHTSEDFGTNLRFCHMDINMGECGKRQDGATDPPHRSHGLCPTLYNNSFEFSFPLVPKEMIEAKYETTCQNKRNMPQDLEIDGVHHLTMGYNLDMRAPDGEYFADTNKIFPYTNAITENTNQNFILLSNGIYYKLGTK